MLTAALAGLGLAAAGQITVGVQDLGTDVDTQLRGTMIQTSFGSAQAATSPAVTLPGSNGRRSISTGGGNCVYYDKPEDIPCGHTMILEVASYEQEDGTRVFGFRGTTYRESPFWVDTDTPPLGDNWYVWSESYYPGADDFIDPPENAADFS